jgi:hypothetical protein
LVEPRLHGAKAVGEGVVRFGEVGWARNIFSPLALRPGDSWKRQIVSLWQRADLRSAGHREKFANLFQQWHPTNITCRVDQVSVVDNGCELSHEI